MTPQVLLVGGGMLARDLATQIPPDAKLEVLDHAALDVTSEAAVTEAVERSGPAWVINTAAFTRVDDAERERETAWAVNATAPGIIGRVCARKDIRVVHFSTDYVFDGRSGKPYGETAPAEPVNAYGESKLAGERALDASGARTLLIRTQWLYGSSGRSFPATMWERARGRKPTRVVNDQTGRPTYAVSLARAVWQLIAADAQGTYHIANRGVATWHEVAARIFTTAGVPELLSPCATAEFKTDAGRPGYSVLDIGKVERAYGVVLPDWTEALDEWIAGRRASEAAE